jgi:N-acylneuraminate cytidylyltransferase/CMP-N,N'-diacetyllegionaminic acid synthase
VYLGKRVLAVVPARAGSKSLPKKNLIVLNNKRLVGWPIEAAIETGICDRIVCSTDSSEIAEIAREYGAEIPFIRPTELASDETPTSEVLLHTIEYFEKKSEFFDYILLLEPTSPLTTSEDIKLAFKKFHENIEISDSLVSITENVAGHPDFSFRLSDKSGIISSVSMSPWVHKRRQDIESCFFIEGSLYISTVKSFKEKGSFIHDRTIGFIVPKWKSFEIDDELDLKIIEMIMQERGIR